MKKKLFLFVVYTFLFNFFNLLIASDLKSESVFRREDNIYSNTSNNVNENVINKNSNEKLNKEFEKNINNSNTNLSYPKMIDEYINDFNETVSISNKKELTKVLDNINRQTGILIVIAVIDSAHSYNTNDYTFESFATNLFNEWRIGDKKKNNGVLFLIATEDRKVRIELGKGYENYYNENAKKIIDEKIIPDFKLGDYNMGIYKGTMALKELLTKEVSWLEKNQKLIILIALFFLFVGIGISLIKNGKSGWGWAFLAFAGIVLIFIIKILLSGNKRSGSSFTGGGGGSSFGGGASGSW